MQGGKHREKLVEHSLKEYHTNPKAKLIIAVALLIDKDKVVQMANVEIEPESYWKSVKEVIGQKATEEIMSDIEEIYGLEGILKRFDEKELIQELIQKIGEKKILRKFDLKTIEKYVKEERSSQ